MIYKKDINFTEAGVIKMYEFFPKRKGIVKFNKDKIGFKYYPEGHEVLGKFKVVESCDYEYWYIYKNIGKFGGIEIQSIALRIDNIIYKNVGEIYINNELMMGDFIKDEEFCTTIIERI